MAEFTVRDVDGEIHVVGFAHVERGINEFEIYLAKWARFRDWEAAHPEVTEKEAVECVH